VQLLEFSLDESSQHEAPRKNGPHGGWKVVKAGLLLVAVVIRDEAADRHAPESIQQGQDGLPDRASHVFK